MPRAVIFRGAIRCELLAALLLCTALLVASPAQAYESYTVRLSRTIPTTLWIGLWYPTGQLGARVFLSPTMGRTERWGFVPQSTSAGLAYSLRNHHSGKCMDILGPSRNDGTEVHQWNCHSGHSQAWRLVRQPLGRVRGHQLINVYAGKCLDVTGFRNEKGTPIQIWSCSHAWNQTFVVEPVAP